MVTLFGKLLFCCVVFYCRGSLCFNPTVWGKREKAQVLELSAMVAQISSNWWKMTTWTGRSRCFTLSNLCNNESANSIVSEGKSIRKQLHVRQIPRSNHFVCSIWQTWKECNVGVFANNLLWRLFWSPSLPGLTSETIPMMTIDWKGDGAHRYTVIRWGGATSQDKRSYKKKLHVPMPFILLAHSRKQHPSHQERQESQVVSALCHVILYCLQYKFMVFMLCRRWWLFDTRGTSSISKGRGDVQISSRIAEIVCQGKANAIDEFGKVSPNATTQSLSVLH